MGDHGTGGIENRTGRAIILLQPDRLTAGIVTFKTKDVADFRTTPAIDRLVVVTNHTEVAMPGSEQMDQSILNLVGILKFVDQNVMKSLTILFKDGGMIFEQAGPSASEDH